jgi:hypothetical protein
LGRKKIDFSTVFASQAVGITEVHDDIWLVSFMDCDLGYFDLDTRVLEPLENSFGPKLSTLSEFARSFLPTELMDAVISRQEDRDAFSGRQ